MQRVSEIEPYLNDAHRRLRAQARDVARQEIAPLTRRLEEAGTHANTDIPALLAKQGWTGVLIPQEPYGGMGAGHVAKMLLIQELSYCSGAAGAILQASLIPALAVQVLGRPEQRAQWLPQIAAGLWTTIAVTEPDSGSDILGMTSTAYPQSDGSWVLEGRKCFIGNSHIAGLHLVVARTSTPGSRDTDALSAFLVEADRDGVTLEQAPFVGLHGFSAGTLRLDNVRVPAANLLGDEGQGWMAAYGASMVCGRLNLAAVALGLHQRLLDDTIAFLTTRPRRGRHLSDNSVVRKRVAEMRSGLMASELAVYHASSLLDRDVPCDPALLNAKLTAKRAAEAAAQNAADLFGGYATRTDHSFARLDRDIRHIAAPAGPDDIQLHHLGIATLGSDRFQWSTLFTRPNTPHETTTAP
ncbi:acyl-CoA dehydrogenase family protein [Streptomyces sp. A1499]|uniref:acyl-CoA dehydrogenase family protein n=1 Tax=Streptomyces sp. A1499 TaxID=2563104 RepID=UPI00109E9B59|nr:acyl-CoA dehydrogenase family protein [Streptomyces sp. A1499]THC43134.1 acyl-CoA dehydrogenase [Streptomyces sp. A1499]